MPGPSSAPSPTAFPSHHRVPVAALEALAAGRHDGGALATLQAGEHSRRLLLLRAVLSYARIHHDSTGPLPPVDAAWRLLARAEGRAPDVVAEMLRQPHMGMWAAHTLRRLRGVSSDQAPLWFHVGQLHALAAAAAIRAGLHFSMTIPVRDGDALLPTLGYTHLPTDTSWSCAEVHTDSGAVRVRHADVHADVIVELPRQPDMSTPGWNRVRTLRTEDDGLSLVVRLEDMSPYRDLDNAAPPDPLVPETAVRWESLLHGAWKLLVRDHRQRAGELAQGMVALVPSPAVARFRPFSASVEDGFGSAILSEPYDAAQLAVTLVHEFQHSKINGIQHLVSLAAWDEQSWGYAPWRDDPRPPGGLIQGVFAFTAVTEFWAVHRALVTGREAELAQFEFALWRRQTWAALQLLREQPALTDIGRRFIAVIADRFTVLWPQPVPPEALMAANAAATDHFAAWRALHLRPDRRLVREATKAWLAGRPPPTDQESDPAVEPCADTQPLDVKAVLARMRIADPAGFASLRSAPELPGRQVAGASPADVAYVAGDLVAAHRLYLAELSETPDRAGAWSGLGLTLAATNPGAAASTLLDRPELVKAISWEVAATTGRAPAPEELATWLGAGP